MPEPNRIEYGLAVDIVGVRRDGSKNDRYWIGLHFYEGQPPDVVLEGSPQAVRVPLETLEAVMAHLRQTHTAIAPTAQHNADIPVPSKKVSWGEAFGPSKTFHCPATED